MSRMLFRFVKCIVFIIVATCACQVAVASDDVHQRKVFAHYVMCCSYAGPNASVEEYQAEIQRARTAGIDGFVLNIGAWADQPLYPRQTSKMFIAAKAFPEFKLFFSLDISGKLSPQDALDMVSRFSADEAYFKRRGRPVVSSFKWDSRWGEEFGKLLNRQKIRIVLVPHIWTEQAVTKYYFASDASVLSDLVRHDLKKYPDIDGSFFFGAAGPYDKIAQLSKIIAQVSSSEGKVFIAPATPFYRGFGRNSRLFDSAGFGGMREQWLSAIEGNATWVEIVTWNDWGESSYVYPFEGDVESIWRGHWGVLLNHAGFLNASRYFMEWFKSGTKPAIKGALADYFYVPQPRLKCSAADKIIKTANCPIGVEKVADRIYIVTQFEEGGGVEIENAGVIRRQFVAGGWNQYDFPLLDGEIRVTLTMGGVSQAWNLPTTFSSARGASFLNYISGTLRLK